MFMRVLKESAPTHKTLLIIYIVLTVLILLRVVNISWFNNPFYDKVISLVLIWFFYPILAFTLEHKYSAKTAHLRARKALGEHVKHLTDDQLRSHIKHP